MTNQTPPEPSTTAEDLAEEYRKTLRDFLGGSHGAHMLNAGKQGYLAGYRSRDAEVERLETARKVHVEELHNADAELTQLRQSLAERDAEVAELKAQLARVEFHDECSECGKPACLDHPESKVRFVVDGQVMIPLKEAAESLDSMSNKYMEKLAESERKAAGLRLDRLVERRVSLNDAKRNPEILDAMIESADRDIREHYKKSREALASRSPAEEAGLGEGKV